MKRRIDATLVTFMSIVVGLLFTSVPAYAQMPFEVLHSFTGHTDPSAPSALIQGSDGNLYGTTTNGGSFNLGTVFRMTRLW